MLEAKGARVAESRRYVRSGVMGLSDIPIAEAHKRTDPMRTTRRRRTSSRPSRTASTNACLTSTMLRDENLRSRRCLRALADALPPPERGKSHS